MSNKKILWFVGRILGLLVSTAAVWHSLAALADAAQPAPAPPKTVIAAAAAPANAAGKPAPAQPAPTKPAPATGPTASAATTPPGKAPVAPPSKPVAQPTEAAPQPTEPAAPPRVIRYKQDMSSEDYKKAVEKFRRDKAAVQKMLRAQMFAAGQEVQFDRYYNEFALPRWTVPENYRELTEFRRELRNELLAAKNGPPYDRLLELVFDYMSKVSGPGYHPAVRYNAMMMIGDLNVQELAPGSRERLQPYPPALKTIINAIKNSDSDAVRVAALLGLQRHASLGIADAQVRDGQIIPMLLDLAKSPPPAGRSPDGHAWLRVMAIDALATLHAVGPGGRPVAPNAELVKTLVSIVADKAMPNMTRSAAARALGTFDYKGFNALTPTQIGASIGQMAVDICSAELAKTRPSATKTAAKPRARGMPGMMPGSYPMGEGSASMPGMMPMGEAMYGAAGAQKDSSDEDADRLVRLQRNLKYYLDGARRGLNGFNDAQNGGIRLYAAKFEPDLKKLADVQDPEWKFVNGVFAAVQEIIKALDGEDEDYAAVAKKVAAARTKLRDLVNSAAPEQGPAPAVTATQ